MKDPLFFISSVFVKTPERVEAIAMIMGLCLLVYNLAQRKLRQELSKFDDGIRNHVNKITNKPTMRWLFQMFQSVHLVIINGQKCCSNLTLEFRLNSSCKKKMKNKLVDLWEKLMLRKRSLIGTFNDQ